MAQVKELTEPRLRYLWREAKGEDDCWGELKAQTLRLAKRLLESAMEEEILEALPAGRHRRSRLRRGYRNAYRHRRLLTEFGLLEELRVPHDRASCYQPALLERYQHRQARVNQLIRELFLAGVSTRRVGEELAPVLGQAP